MASRQPLDLSIFRVQNAQGHTVGTGFVVADRLAVTCAHVALAAGSGSEQPLRIQFLAGAEPQEAHVLTAGWSPSEIDDVAFLRLDHLPQGVVPVVLGLASGCDGHGYRTCGFARTAHYAYQQFDDVLYGVIPVQQDAKRAMLSLQGNIVDGGLSGSPVLDTHTHRVVGMVSEYKDLDRKKEINAPPVRLAGATTTETLVALSPRLEVWPETYGPHELELYLRYVIQTHQSLTLPDGHEVELERVYVSLRADEMSATEWKAEHELYLEDVEAITRTVESSVDTDQYTEYALIRKAIARHPKVLKLTARDWTRLFGEHEQGSLSLAEVVQRHPQVVILGDPGSGKTTLGRWLVLQFARALQQRAPRVEVPADLVRPGVKTNFAEFLLSWVHLKAQADTLLDLGPTRLPIFLRVADYARARWQNEREDTRLPLDRFVGWHENKYDLPSGLTPDIIAALTQASLREGWALVVLDGLDEVADPGQRQAIMHEVKRLLALAPPPALRVQDEWTGNRVLLTSRIVGYQFDPLTDLPHYTVEEMDETAITAFCHAWMRHIATLADAEATEQAIQLKDAVFDEAHPGVRTLAGNPLLLTILAQVYWKSSQRALPTRRVALFEEAARTFYEQREEFWDRAGIPPLRLTRALAEVAAFMHANEPTGFAEESDVRACLRAVLASDEQIEAVLEAAREVSGFLVARGEGVYGFLHRALQEYFVAEQLVSRPAQVSENLVAHCLDPAWREPIVLAVGMVSQRKYPESRRRLPEVFAALLSAPDPVGAFLPRRDLLAAAACAECERIPPGVGERLAENLLACYADREGSGRLQFLHRPIRRAFATLSRSAARAETEAVLCAAVQAPDFERRYGAVDLVIEGKWDSPSIAEALVRAWCTYPDPAGSLLVALDGIQARQPSCFTDEALPLRRGEYVWVWERTRESVAWQSLLRLLYLPPDAPPGAEVAPAQVNRDSPLTESVLTVLGQALGPEEALVTFRHQLLVLAGQPGSARARDAALALSALGETSWVQTWVQAAGDRTTLLLPLFATLTVASDLALARARDRARDLAFDLARARDLAHDPDLARASDLARDLDFDLFRTDERARAFDRAEDRAFDRARAFDRDLARAFDSDRDRDLARGRDLARARARALEASLQEARREWASDAAVLQHLDSAQAALQALEREVAFSEITDVVWAALISAEKERVATVPEAVTAPPEAEERLGTARMQTLQAYVRDLVSLDLETLSTLVDDLVSLDDRRREAARQRLSYERDASTVGLPIIEYLALLAEQHTANAWIGTQLDWALQAITQLISAEKERVATVPEAVTAPPEAEESQFTLGTARMPSPVEQTLQAYVDDLVSLDLEKLSTLARDLVSLDDRRREAARQRLSYERDASTVGLPIIEHLALLAEQHTANAWIGTQLDWALQAITHDRPEWVSAWMAEASATEQMTPAQRILGTLHHVTPETLHTLVRQFPASASWVKKAMLNSLSWLVRLKRIPQERQEFLQTQLLSWLHQESVPTIRHALIDTLGHWQDKDTSQAVSQALLDQLAHTVGERDSTAVCMALARLAAHHPELVEPVRAACLRGSPHPRAAAALARLSLVEASRVVRDGKLPLANATHLRKPREAVSTHLLRKLSELLPPPACLTALLDAGSNDDFWDDDDHGVLSVAICMHLERFPELRKPLLSHLQQALEHQEWQARRMALSAVAACMEVMPTALQHVAGGRLASLLVRGTTDAESHDSRRFALTALSYLRTVTPAVVPALLAGCQDIEVVQQDAIAAAGRFQSIEGELLPGLIPFLTGESVSTAYAVAHLLGALGTSLAGEAAGLRGQIIDALVQALKDQRSQRVVVMASEYKYALEYALSTALLHVAGWTE